MCLAGSPSGRVSCTIGGLLGGFMLPCSPPKLPGVLLFPQISLICSLLNIIYLLTTSFLNINKSVNIWLFLITDSCALASYIIFLLCSLVSQNTWETNTIGPGTYQQLGMQLIHNVLSLSYCSDKQGNQ